MMFFSALLGVVAPMATVLQATTTARCLARHINTGLRPHVECGGNSALPPGCATGSGWTRTRVSNGTASSRANPHAARCAQRAFDTFLCSLPARVGDDNLKPADWAFGADPPSVGKLIGHFSLQLYLSVTQRNPFRHILPTDFLRDWSWRPPHCPASASASQQQSRRRAANSPEAWLRADVCTQAEVASARGTAGGSGSGESPSFTQLRTGARLIAIARGNSSGSWAPREDPLWVATKGGGQTSAGLWVAAQLVRRVRRAMGPCLRARVNALLPQTPLSRPGLQGVVVEEEEEQRQRSGERSSSSEGGGVSAVEWLGLSERRLTIARLADELEETSRGNNQAFQRINLQTSIFFKKSEVQSNQRFPLICMARLSRAYFSSIHIYIHYIYILYSYV